MVGSMKLFAAALTLLVFGGASTWLVFEEGFFGFLHVAARERWALQILCDLAIALVLFTPVMVRDARARGIAAWPFVIMTIVLGSIGLLAYFVVRELKARGQPAGPALSLGRPSASA